MLKKFSLYLLTGLLFGITIVKSEAVSWFRIQEMFRFQSFHMYGIFASAVLIGGLTILLIKKFDLKTSRGESFNLKSPDLQVKRFIIGGLLFGAGWALTGTCIAPIFALVGSGYLAALYILVGALLGTVAYGLVRDKLPH